MSAAPDWVVVATVGQLEADVLKAALETADIPVTMLSETIGRIYSLTAMDLGQVRLLVPSDREEEARALLDSAEPLDFPPGD